MHKRKIKRKIHNSTFIIVVIIYKALALEETQFTENISVCNDVAEKGFALISSHINKSESEEQRHALIQVVEFQ